MPRLIVALLIAASLVALTDTARCAPASAPSVLDESPQPHEPKTVRSEADRDRLHAAALLASARVLERRGEEARALRKYQRAHRYAPRSVTILNDVVSLSYRHGRFDVAARYAIILAEQDPGDPELLHGLGQYLTLQGEWPRAIGLYETILKDSQLKEKSVTTAALRFEVGRLYYLTGNFAAAADAFVVVRQALAHPDRFGITPRQRDALLGEAQLTYTLFGETFLAAGRLDEATQAFEQAHKAEPNAGALAYNLARVAAKKDQHAQAIAKLEQYFAERSASEGTAPYELLVEWLAKSDQSERIAGKLDELQAADPANVPLRIFLARRHLENQQFDKAAEILAALRAGNDPPPLDVFRALVELHDRTGQLDKLLGVFGELIAIIDTLEPIDDFVEPIAADEKRLAELLALARAGWEQKENPQRLTTALAAAQLAVRAGKYDVASEFYRLVVSEKPEPHSFYALAGVLQLNNQTDEALAAARRAVELQPDSIVAMSRVAWIQYHADRYDDAIASYRQLIEKFDQEFDSEQLRDVLRSARIALAGLYASTKQLTQAEQLLELVLDEYPEDPGALNDLGYLWADQSKHLERALRMVQRAVDAEPENPAYLDSLGWAHYRSGNYQEAARWLEKSVAGEQPDGVILDHLGDAYHKLGRTDEAQEAWGRALELFQKANDEQKAADTQKKINVPK